MNQRIWKIVLKPTNYQTIAIPIGAQLLCAREQHEEICVWFRCDPNATKEEREIIVVGTGQQIDSDWKYLGTASTLNGNLISHVFEIFPPSLLLDLSPDILSITEQP